jgi:hypothetical protein
VSGEGCCVIAPGLGYIRARRSLAFALNFVATAVASRAVGRLFGRDQSTQAG